MNVPENLSIKTGEKSVKIYLRRFSCLAPILFVLTLVLNGLFLFFVAPVDIFITMLKEVGWFSAIINLGYFIIIEIILLFFTYSFLSLMINKKVLEIRKDRISSYDSPLPNLARKSVSIERVDYFTSKKSRTYNIQAITKDNIKIILLFGIKNKEEIDFILKNIENYTDAIIKK